jgi:hypothetical protein
VDPRRKSAPPHPKAGARTPAGARTVDGTLRGIAAVVPVVLLAEPVVKTRGDTDPGRQADVAPDQAGLSLAVTDYLDDLRNGDGGAFDEACDAFNDVVRPETALSWIRAVLTDADIVAQAVSKPALFCTVIARYQFLKAEGFDTCTDGELTGYLTGFDTEGAEEVAARLIFLNWKSPWVLDGAVCAWLLGIPGLRDAEAFPGLSARLLNMLWNIQQFEPICALIDAGIDTSTPSYVDATLTSRTKFVDQQTGIDWTPEGFYQGYVQPLEHLLGNYVYLVSLALLTEKDAVHIGMQTPGVDLRNRKLLLQLGRSKVAGAGKVLQALARRGDAQMLTSFTQVQQSPLIKAFVSRRGTIWGFESIRLMFVQAAHLTDLGKQPVRMFELWAVVEAMLTKQRYVDLLERPEETITEIVVTAVATLDDMFRNYPLEFPGLHDQQARRQFRVAFKEQCRGYLQVLSERPPTIKFDTAVVRGYAPGKYLGAGGCKVGLWWAQKQGTPVYYCLDGVNDEDVIWFKTRKTQHINDFIEVPCRPEYVEVITLAEIREILTNWTDLRSTVQFCRKGVFLTEAQVADLIRRMQAADATMSAPRSAPLRELVDEVWAAAEVPGLPALTGPVFDDMGVGPYYHVATQLLLMDMALKAANNAVLSSFLTSKGARVLFDTGLLPNGFGQAYQSMALTQPAAVDEALVAKLQRDVQTGNLPDQFKHRLLAAIGKSAALGTPTGNPTSSS